MYIIIHIISYIMYIIIFIYMAGAGPVGGRAESAAVGNDPQGERERERERQAERDAAAVCNPCHDLPNHAMI
jgi:hypothetical protein